MVWKLHCLSWWCNGHVIVLEKVFVIGWRKKIIWTCELQRTHNTWRWRTALIKSEHCYWMTTSLYRKYNTFSGRESEQQHRTMTFAELPNHPILLTMHTCSDWFTQNKKCWKYVNCIIIIGFSLTKGQCSKR